MPVPAFFHSLSRSRLCFASGKLDENRAGYQSVGAAIAFDIPSLHRPLARYFRRRRFERFARAFGLTPATRVLDDGGYAYYWSYFAERPRVTIVNLEPPAQPAAGLDWVIADGRQLPFRDGSFEIVFSNSVIEHVGDSASRQEYAHEVDRVGQSYYVQTPNFWFPVEPHLMTPFIHFLPAALRRKLLRNFTLWGILVRPTPEGCDHFVREIRLLDAAEMRSLFPNARLWRERFLGMTKSLIAVKKSD